jgi:hypothetical protein
METLMLNRKFFENEFPGIVEAFSSQQKCDKPVMQIGLYSGQTLLALKILKIEDRWIHVEALTENREIMQTFIPYKNIAQLSLFAKLPSKGTVGF